MLSLINLYSPHNYKFLIALADSRLNFIIGGGWSTYYHKGRTKEQMIGRDIDIYISTDPTNLRNLRETLNFLQGATTLFFNDEKEFITNWERPGAHLQLAASIYSSLFMVEVPQFVLLNAKSSIYQSDLRSFHIMSKEDLIRELNLGIKRELDFPDKQKKHVSDLNALLSEIH